jgi:hypothetical protein
MLADCNRCVLRDIACPECVISVIEDGPARLSPEEVRALRVLAEAGLVPPLRFAPAQTAGPAVAACAAAAPGPGAVPRAAPVPGPAGSGPGRPAVRGAGARPADPRQGRRTGSPHPYLKSHGPRPALLTESQDRVESRRIG